MVTACDASHELLADGAMQIADAVAWSGLARTKLYDAMNRGELPFIKDGKRRLIPKRGLMDYLARRMERNERQP